MIALSDPATRLEWAALLDEFCQPKAYREWERRRVDGGGEVFVVKFCPAASGGPVAENVEMCAAMELLEESEVGGWMWCCGWLLGAELSEAEHSLVAASGGGVADGVDEEPGDESGTLRPREAGRACNKTGLGAASAPSGSSSVKTEIILLPPLAVEWPTVWTRNRAVRLEP
mmetsp:Transcript_79516/g.207303  ORF Transcript_79516/g.207303 Transcript_79516/m.207303 type:complete len:172 (+) Transcript_79516:1-516(+)